MRALLDNGLSGAAIARELGISKSTVSYHKRRLGEPLDTRCNRRYDWDAVQRFYDAGHSISECQVHFGFARRMKVKWVWTRGALLVRVRVGAGDDELKRRVWD